MITRIGSGAATSSTQSPPPRSTTTSSSSSAMARVRSVYRRIWRGVNALLTTRRSRVCAGGSCSRIDRRASNASASRSHRLTCPMADEKRSGWRDTSHTSAWRVTAQKPPFACGSAS